MRIVQQTGSAILETDHELSPRETQRIQAQLQAIGIEAVILPMGVSVACMAEREIDE